MANDNDSGKPWARGPFRIPVGYCADARLIVEVCAPDTQDAQGVTEEGALLAEVWVCPQPRGVLVLLKDDDGKEIERMGASYLEAPPGGELVVDDKEWGVSDAPETPEVPREAEDDMYANLVLTVRGRGRRVRVYRIPVEGGFVLYRCEGGPPEDYDDWVEVLGADVKPIRATNVQELITAAKGHNWLKGEEAE